MIDGAKRDRAIWSGDMNVEIPSIAYSTDNTAYAKGALELLGSYQLTSGFVTGDLPPQDDLSPSKPSGSTGSYSADYSIYWLLDLADYYLYSGDTAFVTQELPIVTDELAWDASQVNSTGLLVTTSSDDADWDFYDPGKTGEVTEYNLLYYKALLDGAVLATAAGDTHRRGHLHQRRRRPEDGDQRQPLRQRDRPVLPEQHRHQHRRPGRELARGPLRRRPGRG